MKKLDDRNDSLGAESRDREIEAMVHEAHRRPADPIRAPAILRHRSFLFLSPGGIKKNVAELIEALPSWDGTRRGLDPLDSILQELPIAGGALEQILAGWRLRLRAEIHTEYVSITLIIDSFDAEGRGRNDLYDKLQMILRGDCGDSAVSASYADILFDEIWSRVDTALGVKKIDSLGDSFADFRGLAIIPVALGPLKQGENEVQMPDGDTTRNRREMLIDPTLRDFVRDRPNLMAAILDLRTSDIQVARQATNVVMCGMLDGAAIYATSLGAASNRKTTPQRYVVAYNGRSSNQFGRFLQLMQEQSEMRVAGLIDLLKLRYASEQISHLSAELGSYARTLSDKTEVSGDSIARFNRLQAEVWSVGKECRGGLRYRINRSRHYERAFRERMLDLRIVRIEGWQPYDEFVRRNLYKSFDFINQVGDGYDTLISALAGLNGLNMLQQTRSITENTRQARDLLSYAEFVGWAAFSYYFGEIVGTFLYALWPESIEIGSSWLASGGMHILAARPNSPESQMHAQLIGWAVAFFLYWPLRSVTMWTISGVRKLLRVD